MQLQQSVGGEYDFWTAVTGASMDWACQAPDTPLASLGIHYGDAATLADLYADNLALAQQEIRTPLIFYFARGFGSDIDTQHLSAHRLLLERGISRGAWAWLLEQRPWGAQWVWPWDQKIAQPLRQADPAPWAQADLAGERVLGQLILMDLGGAPHEAEDRMAPEEGQRLKDLLHAAGWKDDPTSVRSFRDEWLWFATHAPAVQGKIDLNARAWAGSCVDRMIGYYNDAYLKGAEARRALVSAAGGFDQKEQAFLQSASQATDAGVIRQAWTSPGMADLLDAGAKLSAALENLKHVPGQDPGCSSSAASSTAAARRPASTR
jgi:hypothetical protein